jgi:hypothetical protein
MLSKLFSLCVVWCERRFRRFGVTCFTFGAPKMENMYLKNFGSYTVQEQFGLRTHHSTENAIFSLINSILTALNNKQMVWGISCDLQKASDCVNHKILLEKLEFYGIVGIFKTLIKSYLTGRNQRVILDQRTEGNNSSKWEIIKCGVPQGSILGPLFFLIYINYLHKIINEGNNMVLYADDTSIIITDRMRQLLKQTSIQPLKI